MPIDQDAFFLASTHLYSQLGDIDDLPPDLSNTIANSYYKFWMLKADVDRAFDDESIDLMPALFKYMKDSAAVTAQVHYFPDAVTSLRALREENPRLYDYTAICMLDSLKYGIPNASSKTPIRRAIERKFTKPNEIEGLYRLFCRKKPENPTEQKKALELLNRAMADLEKSLDIFEKTMAGVRNPVSQSPKDQVPCPKPSESSSKESNDLDLQQLPSPVAGLAGGPAEPEPEPDPSEDSFRDSLPPWVEQGNDELQSSNGKVAINKESRRCLNVACNRLLPVNQTVCFHCGTRKIG